MVKKLLVAFSLLLAFALISGCSVSYKHTAVHTQLPAQARIAYLLVSPSGGGSFGMFGAGGGFPYAMSNNLVYNAMINNGLNPVSLNSVQMYNSYLKELHKEGSAKLEKKLKVEGTDKEGTVKFTQYAMFFENIQGYLKDMKIDYILLYNLNFACSNGEYVQAILVRVEDLTVIGSRYHYIKSGIMGCGIDPDNIYRITDDTLKAFMGGGARRPATYDRSRRRPPRDDRRERRDSDRYDEEEW